MKTEKNILIAFILNFAFSIFEFVGGIFTGSIAIISDAIHDLGDSVSIGISFFLEKKSKLKPDEIYTYGYTRFSILGSLITNLILLLGSLTVIYNAVVRIINPKTISYDGMIIFAVVGVVVNFLARIFTKHGDSLNQKAVSLHMLEDLLGWVVVLIGAIVMRFTNFYLLDSIMSIGVSIFILINAIKGLKEGLILLLEKIPSEISVEEIKEHILEIDGISDVHHIHIWSMDGQNNYATMHIVTDEDSHHIKEKVREELSEHRIQHATLELEKVGEHCHHKECTIEEVSSSCHHHHH